MINENLILVFLIFVSLIDRIGNTNLIIYIFNDFKETLPDKSKIYYPYPH